MSRLRALVLSHRWAIILAVLASLIAAAPQAYFRIDHRDDGVYQGIELLPDSPWSARAREVMDGHPNFGAIYYKDGKDNPYLFQPLGSIVVAYTGQLFGLDINNTLLLSRLLYTAAAFLLMYAFVLLLSGAKAPALAIAAVLVLGEAALEPAGVLSLLRGMSPEDFLQIARPINPAMVYIFFFGFLTAFWKFYERFDWRWGALAAVLLGLNFYNYFYTWTYLFAFGGLLGLFLLFRRQWDALYVAAVYVGGLLVGLPYLFNLYAATQHAEYIGASLRKGVIETHGLLPVGFMVIAALAAYVLWYPREDKKRYFFGLALLLAPFVTLNQQVITGKVLQPGHYHWFFHKPIAVIVLLLLAFLLLAKWRPAYQKALAILLIGGSIAAGTFIQAASYVSGTNDGGRVAVERQKYGPVVGWLNEHAQPEEVVFANNEASHMVVIYTPLNVSYHRAGMYSLAATKERLLDVYLAFYRLRGVSEREAREVFFAERDLISANIYGMHYRELSGAYEAIPDEKIEEIVAQYREALSMPASAWLRSIFKTYEVSYIVWDREADPAWGLDRYPFLKQAADFGQMSVYRVQ